MHGGSARCVPGPFPIGKEFSIVFLEESFFRRHWILSILGVILVIVLSAPGIALWYLGRGPFPDYSLDLLAPKPGDATPAGVLEVGVSKRDISPNFAAKDAWTDVNDNGKYDEGVDSYEDRNGNGKFDGIWIAGFDTNRPAKGIHDAPWVRALALRNNGVTLALVTIDSIGIFHNEFIRIRKMIDPALGITHAAFSSTHCHELPDTMGNWSFWRRIQYKGKDIDVPIWGYDRQYMDFICQMAKEAIEEAVKNLKPADMYCTQVQAGPEGFVRDTRKPVVFDPNMYLFRFTEQGTDRTIATFVNWGNHPEALGGDNPIITSDFPHFLREGMENGLPAPNGVQGFGGMCLYFQGMIGGLMTQLGVEVPDRDGQRAYKDSSFEKAAALGQNAAIVACNALRGPNVWKNENPRLAVTAKTFLAPMSGMFKWAVRLGALHEGYFGSGRARSEIDVIRIGGVLILTIPGEIYSEIVQGGVEALPGRDFPIDPIEVPRLRLEMEKNARMAFVLGLANDEIGYIIPKSQWDAVPPYVYDNSDQYGEENSGGPDIAPTIHQEALQLLQRMNAVFAATK